MQEDFLHYIWQYQKFSVANLVTVQGKQLTVLAVGEYNTNSGPDFYNSKIVVEEQQWAGTVEIHVKSSDWFAHQHQDDATYDNVILHVVWEDDVAVFDVNQNVLETLVLKDIVDETLLHNYKRLVQQKNWINCENQIQNIDAFTLSFWKEKLLIQRLQRKSLELQELLSASQNNWEALLFLVLAKNFGLKINDTQFLQLANGISFSIFKKEMSDNLSLEALLFGQANLLEENIEDAYYQKLQQEHAYLKQKHRLQDSFMRLQFFRLRPASFPTIRLSQFAMLYHKNKRLFSEVIAAKTASELQSLFTVAASEYWNTHYTFGKSSIKRKKKLSKTFFELLMINTIIPIKFMYAKSQGKENFEELLQLYKELKSEKNTIVNQFKVLKIKVESSADSQSLLELKTRYCDKHKCLHCEIGNKLLYQS